MLLNVAAHNVSIRNIKVCERHILHTIFNTYVICTLHFAMVYVLGLLRCVQLRFVTLHHVTFTLCCFTLYSNIDGTPGEIM
jgi:hypothetical protein